MAFVTLGEAVDRVLARLVDQREGKTGAEILKLSPGKGAAGGKPLGKGGGHQNRGPAKDEIHASNRNPTGIPTTRPIARPTP